MFSPLGAVRAFPFASTALALGLWGLSGGSAMAQGGTPSPGLGGGRMSVGVDSPAPGSPPTMSGVGTGVTGGPGSAPGRPPLADDGRRVPATPAPGVPPGSYGMPAGSGVYSSPVYVVPPPGFGVFGPGYPGFGLDYTHGCALRYHLRHDPEHPSLHRWGAYVLGKENLHPYVADPYSDPSALGFGPPYSAPAATTAYPGPRP